MLGLLKRNLFKIRLALADSNGKAELFRKELGIKIGKNVRFTGTPVWASEPYLIEIGNNVTITQNVTFHTHDGGVALFRKKFPGINVFGKIKIGNNVFIGSDAIIMPGVTIGDNVVIGAGSIVSKDIPSNTIAAGVPAKPLKTLEEYRTSTLEKSVIVTETDPHKRRKQIEAFVNK